MEYLKEIIAFVLGLGAGWTLKIVFDRSRNSTTIRNNRVGGDLAGRDINKK